MAAIVSPPRSISHITSYLRTITDSFTSPLRPCRSGAGPDLSMAIAASSEICNLNREADNVLKVYTVHLLTIMHQW